MVKSHFENIRVATGIRVDHKMGNSDFWLTINVRREISIEHGTYNYKSDETSNDRSENARSENFFSSPICSKRIVE